MDVLDLEGDTDAAMRFLDGLRGRPKLDAMKLIASMVAAIYTDGQPLRKSPPEKMERLLGRLCTAGSFFSAEVQCDPVYEAGEKE